MRTLVKDGCTVKVAQSHAEAKQVLKLLQKQREEKEGAHVSVKPCALDFETTALRPDEHDKARVRLTSVSFEPLTAYVIDHDKSIPFAEMADDLIEAAPYYVFNVGFEGRWFDHNVSSVTALSHNLLDVGHMHRAVMGGGPLWLKTLAKKCCGITLDKEQQNSDWGNYNLSANQYFYSGFDSIITRDIAEYYIDEMNEGHWNGFFVINEAWRAVNECEDSGLLMDAPYHRKLIRMWEARRQAAETSFRKFIPIEHVNNMRSKKQLSDLFKTIFDKDAIEAWPKTAKTQQLNLERGTLRQMSYNAPYPVSRVLAALMVFNRADKYVGTYGETLVTKQELSADGRVHGRLNMAQAITGRFSSSNPNMQNFPRAAIFRRSFIAGRKRKLIIGDYSGVEIRVLAELSQDQILLHDAIYDDVHSRSAIAIFQIPDPDDFIRIIKHDPKKDPPLTPKEKALKVRYKEMRSKAKAFTFQLLYGAGPGALAIALRCTFEEAVEAIEKWAARYKQAYHYRQIMFEKMRSTGFLPCASGRQIFVHRNERSMPVAANYPIQGSAGDVMYKAMTRVQEVLETRNIAARLLVSVHDELLLLSKEECAEEALEALEYGMRLGWLDIFPDSNTDNLAEAAIGDRWSDKV